MARSSKSKFLWWWSLVAFIGCTTGVGYYAYTNLAKRNEQAQRARAEQVVMAKPSETIDDKVQKTLRKEIKIAQKDVFNELYETYDIALKCQSAQKYEAAENLLSIVITNMQKIGLEEHPLHAQFRAELGITYLDHIDYDKSQSDEKKEIVIRTSYVSYVHKLVEKSEAIAGKSKITFYLRARLEEFVGNTKGAERLYLKARKLHFDELKNEYYQAINKKRGRELNQDIQKRLHLINPKLYPADQLKMQEKGFN